MKIFFRESVYSGEFMKKVVSFLVSGRGSNFSAVAQSISSGVINAKLGIVISDNQDAKALIIGKEMGLMTYFIDPKVYHTKAEHEHVMAELFNNVDTDLIVTAGYMRILTPFFVQLFQNRIINIHPALLPSFPGTHGQQKALDYGVKITGCTTHFIDDGTDTGPIILQAAVQVYDNDSLPDLSNRILKEEHRILIESVRLFCDNMLRVSGRKVYINK